MTSSTSATPIGSPGSTTTTGAAPTLAPELPGGFKFREDHLSASKRFTLPDGTTRNFVVYFKPTASIKDKIDLLNRYQDDTIKYFGEQAQSLGLGKTFKAMQFGFDSDSGQLSEIWGKIKDDEFVKLNEKYFNDKIAKAQKTLGEIQNSTTSGGNQDAIDELNKKIETLQRKLTSFTILKKKSLQLFTTSTAEIPVSSDSLKEGHVQTGISITKKFEMPKQPPATTSKAQPISQGESEMPLVRKKKLNAAELQKAADQGNAEAQYKLGLMYAEGKGVEQNLEKAALWYEKAANQGNADAQYKFGVMYEDGESVKQDFTKAAEWYEKAAKQGHANAQFNLGSMYERGEGVKQDLEKAALWYESAANQNDAEAQFNLGEMYENGEGVKQDLVKAAEWYQKAANQGNARAQYNLGKMYENGKGVKQDLVKAAEWYQKAANQGNARAQYNLGLMNYNGKGVEQNFITAAEWYQKAAVQDYADAQYNLGLMHKKGEGVKQDDKKAKELLEKAAKQGVT